MFTENSYQKKIAQGCDVTVVTAADPLIHHRGVVEKAIKDAFHEESRYDLLSFTDLAAAFSGDFIQQTAGDVMTAVSLHHAEKVLVLVPDSDAKPFVERLTKVLANDQKAAKLTIVPVRAVIGASPPYSTLVVSCMDWRLHSPRGFLSRQLERTLTRDYGLMTIPGVAKDVAHGDKVRTQMFSEQMLAAVRRGVDRLVLVSHTDCGKYGGAKNFKTYLDQFGMLRDDLRATEKLARRCGIRRVDIAIASIEIGALCTVA